MEKQIDMSLHICGECANDEIRKPQLIIQTIQQTTAVENMNNNHSLQT